MKKDLIALASENGAVVITMTGTFYPSSIRFTPAALEAFAAALSSATPAGGGLTARDAPIAVLRRAFLASDGTLPDLIGHFCNEWNASIASTPPQSAPQDAQPVEPAGWREALNFYASGNHFTMHEPDAWDTVSGEPTNFFEDESNTATVEDGEVARQALLGTPLQDEEYAPQEAGKAHEHEYVTRTDGSKRCIDCGDVKEASKVEPVADEREAFEKWHKSRPGYPYAGKFLDIAWPAWQARAAIALDQSEKPVVWRMEESPGEWTYFYCDPVNVDKSRLQPLYLRPTQKALSDAKDAARLQWYFGPTDKREFIMTWSRGIQERWALDKWREAIDAAILATAGVSEK